MWFYYMKVLRYYNSAKKSDGLLILLLGRLCMSRFRFPPFTVSVTFRVSKYCTFQNLISLLCEEEATKVPLLLISMASTGKSCCPTIPRWRWGNTLVALNIIIYRDDIYINITNNIIYHNPFFLYRLPNYTIFSPSYYDILRNGNHTIYSLLCNTWKFVRMQSELTPIEYIHFPLATSW